MAALRSDLAASLRFALLPVAGGVALFGGWVVTRDWMLVVVGALYLCFAGGCAAAALVRLWFYERRALRVGVVRRLRRRTCLAVGGLLLANFALAFVLLVAVAWLSDRTVLVVRNDSGALVGRLELAVRGQVRTGGPLGPGEEVRLALRGAGVWRLCGARAAPEGPIESRLEGYRCSGDPQRMRVTVEEGGRVLRLR